MKYRTVSYFIGSSTKGCESDIQVEAVYEESGKPLVSRLKDASPNCTDDLVSDELEKLYHYLQNNEDGDSQQQGTSDEIFMGKKEADGSEELITSHGTAPMTTVHRWQNDRLEFFYRE